jgi:hypothetical protein
VSETETGYKGTLIWTELLSIYLWSVETETGYKGTLIWTELLSIYLWSVETETGSMINFYDRKPATGYTETETGYKGSLLVESLRLKPVLIWTLIWTQNPETETIYKGSS